MLHNMVMLMNKKYDVMKYNPFKKFRPYQEDAIQDILDAKESGIQNIILKAPVASGKSLIAYVIAQYLFEEHMQDSFLFTSTKLLQDQYLRDFASLKTVKGRNNFQCLHNGRTCDKGSCKEICGFSCPNGVTPDLSLKLTKAYSCPYWSQKIEAINAPISILNYKFALVDYNYVRHFIPRDFAVFDEAHNLEKEIMDFFEVEISPRQLFTDIKYQIDIGVRDLLKWADIFFTISDLYGAEAKNKLELGDKEKADMFNSKKDTYKKTAYLMQDNPENWVIDIQDNNLIFKPILINLYANSSLLNLGQTRLFMSGSILKNNSFCETLGITENYKIIEVPSIIKPSQRPVYKEYAGSMSMRNRQKNLLKIAHKIEDIASRYPNDKGVVHTYTYTISNMLQKVLDNDRFIFHDSRNRQQQTEKFIQSDEPKIFVSPYSFEGVDFKDDLARFQIIAKNPFPNMFNNNQYKERDRISNFHWIFEERCKILSQMYGRIVRTPDDYGDTYLIDSDIESLLGPSSLVTYYMFEGFIDDWKNKEIIIVDENKLTKDKRRSYEQERQNERSILNEIKCMENPTVNKLTELYKNLPNDSYKEIKPICERLVLNEAVLLR